VAGPVDRIGSAVNPQWTGLNTNGTWGLYADIAGGVLTPVNGCLPLPKYVEGNAYDTTNNQFSFSKTEFVGKVGTGSGANQAYRVCLGQATVAGGVVTSITWYALNGWAKTPDVACVAANTDTNFSHRLGVPDAKIDLYLRCLTAQVNITVGEVVHLASSNSTSTRQTIIVKVVYFFF
jgi:hypothetical protein